MQSVPFPSNDHVPANQSLVSDKESGVDPKTLPWKKLHANETTPICFEVHLRNGQINAYSYNDFRGFELLHEGHLIVNVFGMDKTQIVICGRNLSELANHLGSGRIRWFGETRKKDYELPEAAPCIEEIRTVVVSD